MQAEFFTTRPVTIDIPIFQPLYALVALGVVIFVVAWVLVHRHEWRQWLAKLPRLDDHAGVNVVYYAAIALALFWLPLTALTIDGLFELWYSKPNPAGEGFTENTLRLHFLALAGLTTILAGLVGAPLALLRVHTVERQTTAQEEGLITDRINKAVASLGADKTIRRHKTNDAAKRVYKKGDDGQPDYSQPVYEEVTAPNLEVRIGAIYALERIAQDSLRDHIQIMEILCAYIRQNAPASEAPELPKPPAWFSMMGDNGLLWGLIFDAWRKKHGDALNDIKPRADVQTALTVIGRRSDKQIAKEWGSKECYEEYKNGPPEFPDFQADKTGAPTQGWRDVVESWQRELGEWKQLKPAYRLDLRETNLRKADMSGQSQKADFSHARFEGADVQRADLVGAEAQGAVFVGAQSQGADFRDAQAQGAVFGRAQAQGANFSQVQGAEFRFAQAQGAEFRFARGANFWYAQVQGAVFSQVQGADFRYAQAQGAEFRYAVAQGADFGDAQAQGADFWEAKFDEKTKFSATEFLSIALKSDISMLKLTQEQVNAAFGDGFTAAHLPDGLTKPDHWPDWEMNPFEFYEKWRKWQREGTAYKPPPAPVE